MRKVLVQLLIYVPPSQGEKQKIFENTSLEQYADYFVDYYYEDTVRREIRKRSMVRHNPAMNEGEEKKMGSSK